MFRFPRAITATAGVATATLMSLATVAAPASAASSTPASEATNLVRANPGARRLDATTVRLGPGLIAKALPGTATLGVPTKCDYKYVCMYSDAQDAVHGGGWLLEAYQCGYFDLGQLSYPDGGRWNDRISALYNNQTPGTGADFYNFNGSNRWDLEIGLNQGDYLLDLSTSGQGANDVIDGIDVCDTGNIDGWRPTTPISQWVGQQKLM